MTFASRFSRHLMASSITNLISWADSGAGIIPSVLREYDRRLEDVVSGRTLPSAYSPC